MRALYAGVCWVCESTFPAGAEVAVRKDDIIHASCASGFDDE